MAVGEQLGGGCWFSLDSGATGGGGGLIIIIII